ncbi:peptidase inhibitor family I36 protein [Streptomyces sp. NPDC101227]|uniref:peptidase inhibitor family I36 protein n=1 Tax=Streptomyces sp. NPDC101227 TaxID=3366136 RepID=UPI0038027E88
MLRPRTPHTTAIVTGLAALTAALAVSAALATPAAHAAAGGRTTPASGDCAAGRLCVWPSADFGGKRRTYELSDTDIESCVPLPGGSGAASFANRTGRPVTTYQSAECAETAEFDTYPGGGSWVPRSPYQVRAFKIWER